jgi:hypothetical protein
MKTRLASMDLMMRDVDQHHRRPATPYTSRQPCGRWRHPDRPTRGQSTEERRNHHDTSRTPRRWAHRRSHSWSVGRVQGGLIGSTTPPRPVDRSRHQRRGRVRLAAACCRTSHTGIGSDRRQRCDLRALVGDGLALVSLIAATYIPIQRVIRQAAKLSTPRAWSVRRAGSVAAAGRFTLWSTSWLWPACCSPRSR